MSIYYPRALVVVEALFKADVETRVFVVTPYNVEWRRNNPRAADTATITLPYRDFPLDPRILSAVHVLVYAADAGGSEVVLEMSPQNLRFQGFVDVPETTLSDDEAEVKFECRDYTALYLDRSWRRVADEEIGKSKKSRILLPKNTTLKAFVEDVVKRIRPEGATAFEEPPIVFDSDVVAAQRVDKRAGKNRLAMRDSDTAWDVLTMVCEWFGQIPSWDLDPEVGPVLRIRPASSFSQVVAKLTFGENVERISFRRDLMAPERKAIRLIAWNPRLGEVVEGLWPELGQASGENSMTLDENAVKTSVTTRSNLKRVQYVVEGDYTEADLTDMAELLYEEQAQGRIMGTVDTPHMMDLEDINLLDLSNGDRLICRLGPEVDAGLGTRPEDQAFVLSDPGRSNALPFDVALALTTAHAEIADLEIEFFVLEARHTWDHLEGYAITVDFTDFLLDQVTRQGEGT